MLRIERTLSERVNSVHIAHFLKILVIPYLNLLDLVRGTETVKEIDERNSALNRGKVSYRTQVHNFLRVGLCEHRETGLTAGVNV